MSWKDDLNYGLGAFGVKLPDGIPIERWAAKLDESPCHNAAALVGLSSLLFYAAERGRNPKVNDVFDAMVYTSTCLSVGYGDIFAKTPLGKVLGSALMTIGPALAAKTLDGPDVEWRDAVRTEMLETLKQILAKLGTPGEEGR
jgi:voltage-gated potassium channel